MCISSKCNIEISVETLFLQQIEGLNYRPEKLDTCRYACIALLAASAYLNGHQPQGPCKVLLSLHDEENSLQEVQTYNKVQCWLTKERNPQQERCLSQPLTLSSKDPLSISTDTQ